MAIKYADGSSSADGRIIQIANAQIAGNNIRTQSNAPNAWKKVVSNSDEVCQISFTPKAATNKLLIVASGIWHGVTGYKGHGMEAKVRLYDNTSGNAVGPEVIDTGSSYTGGTSYGDYWGAAEWTVTAFVEADHNSNGTNTRVYWPELWFDGNQTFYYGYAGDRITVTEISASS